ncbi:MAG TPA: alpha/beta hydrolase [Micromonosporaceae bacterium]|nr:alpha/beta hydrolase [Micromonosporaceae bacterium]HCU48789.1 alpha/beta hydrolase [Micromonosporaceae bacterium]
MEQLVAADDGCKLWTADSGSGHGLITCHGGPGMWDMFADLAPDVGASARVLRWDQRGCGRSGRQGPYTIERSIADIEAIRRHYDLGKVAVLGHSWGATLALMYALAYPEQVSRLVYVSGTGVDADRAWNTTYERNFQDRLGDSFMSWASLKARSRSRAEEREFLALQLGADFADGQIRESQTARILDHGFEVNYQSNDQLTEDMHHRFASGTVLESCRLLRLPILVVDGSQDIRPRWSVDSLCQALPEVQRLTFDTGHIPWAEDEAGFVTAVRRFLE